MSVAFLKAGVKSLTLLVTQPFDVDGTTPRDDLVGIKVWYSTETANFNPLVGQGTLYYEGNGLTVTMVDLINTEYYVKYALISEIDPDVLVVSAALVGTPASADVNRSAFGYVYYSTAQDTAPAVPVATGFSFETGAFTGLTSDWSLTPNIPSVAENNASQKYWASNYVVAETGPGLPKSITFGTPSVHLNFTGIVTFSNLNNSTNSSGNTATIIDGSAIKTDSIDANRIKTNTVLVGQQIRSNDGTFIIDFTDAGKYISISV
jgi:hypothetical protein